MNIIDSSVNSRGRRKGVQKIYELTEDIDLVKEALLTEDKFRNLDV